MKIIGSRTSPFVRIVRVLCAELNMDYMFDEVPPFSNMTPEAIARIKEKNPLMKIPVLVDGDRSIIDSRVIASYLLKKSSGSLAYPFSLEEENEISIIYGVLDAGILRFIMSRDKIDLNTGYMKKSSDRIETGLSFLDTENLNNKEFGFCHIALVCALEWLDKRQMLDWSAYENIKKIHEQHKDRSSFVQTRIPENA